MRATVNVIVLLFLSCAPQMSLSAQYHLHAEAGRSVTGETLSAGQTYHLWFVTVGTSRGIADLTRRIRLSALLELHTGIARVNPHEYRELDMALNIATDFRWQISRSIFLCLSAGSGPGFQTSASPKQARGFIFSNHVAFGVRFPVIRDNILLSMQIRFRHMSNARIRNPNAGIDNFLFLAGVTIPLAQRISVRE